MNLLVEHELTPQIGVSAGYYRTWFGNRVTTDNLAVAPVDFEEYCITTPVDARLPGGCGTLDAERPSLPEKRSPLTQAMTNLCHMLLISNEFLYVD